MGAKKILFVLNTFPGVGGIESVTQTVIGFLHQRYDIYTLAFFQDPSFGSVVGVTKSFWFPSVENQQENIDFYNELVARLDVDIVINQGLSPYVTKILLNPLRKKDCRVYSFLHGMPSYEKAQFWQLSSYLRLPLWRRWLKRVKSSLGLCKSYNRYCREFKRAYRDAVALGDKIVLLSDGYKEDFVKYYDLSDYKDRITAISNPLPILYNSATLDWEKKENILLFVGRLSREKRVERLIEAWSLIEDKCDWECVVVGDGDQKEMLQKTAEKLHLKRVNFVGSTPYPEFYYEKAKIIALTSEFEGLPMSLLEAMSMGGVPVVYSISQGVSELVGDTGIVLQRNEVRDYSVSLLELINSPDHLRHLSKLAFSKAQANYTIEAIRCKWELLLR